MRTVLFGGTDLTLAVADRLERHLVGVVSIARDYRISFQPGGATNARYADVGAWADARGVPHTVWSGVDDAAAFVDELSPDWGLAAGWFFMLPGRLLDRFPLGVAGLHASLLPALRGNAPLNWAILTGLTESGVSLFRLTPGLDDGPLYGQERFPVGPRDTVADLIARTEAVSLRLITAAADALASGTVNMAEQVGEPSYCLARTPADGRIDWRADVDTVDRLVRATTRPYPGAWTTLDETTVNVWAGEPFNAVVHGRPGQVWRSPDGVVVVCGSGAYRISDATIGGDDALPVLRKASQRHLDRPAPQSGWSMGWPT